MMHFNHKKSSQINALPPSTPCYPYFNHGESTKKENSKKGLERRAYNSCPINLKRALNQLEENYWSQWKPSKTCTSYGQRTSNCGFRNEHRCACSRNHMCSDSQLGIPVALLESLKAAIPGKLEPCKEEDSSDAYCTDVSADDSIAETDILSVVLEEVHDKADKAVSCPSDSVVKLGTDGKWDRLMPRADRFSTFDESRPMTLNKNCITESTIQLDSIQETEDSLQSDSNSKAEKTVDSDAKSGPSSSSMSMAQKTSPDSSGTNTSELRTVMENELPPICKPDDEVPTESVQQTEITSEEELAFPESEPEIVKPNSFMYKAFTTIKNIMETSPRPRDQVSDVESSGLQLPTSAEKIENSNTSSKQSEIVEEVVTQSSDSGGNFTTQNSYSSNSQKTTCSNGPAPVLSTIPSTRVSGILRHSYPLGGNSSKKTAGRFSFSRK